ncbi:MAG: hypothetical protein ACK6BG_02025 [Cyanobacteriota bacterium]|jgi:hypothetical protein
MPSPESEPSIARTGTESVTLEESSLAGAMRALPETIARWVKTPCGRAKYLELAQRRGVLARLRRWGFVLIAALRDWRLPAPPSP